MLDLGILPRKRLGINKTCLACLEARIDGFHVVRLYGIHGFMIHVPGSKEIMLLGESRWLHIASRWSTVRSDEM